MLIQENFFQIPFFAWSYCTFQRYSPGHNQVCGFELEGEIGLNERKGSDIARRMIIQVPELIFLKSLSPTLQRCISLKMYGLSPRRLIPTTGS